MKYLHAAIFLSITTTASAEIRYTVTDLLTVGGTWWIEAHAINNAGQVVGRYPTNTSPISYARAFVWENGTMTALGTLGGNISLAKDINEAGVIAGYASAEMTATRAVLWERIDDQWSIVNLGTPGGIVAAGQAINDSKYLTGYGQADPTELERAFVYHDGIMTALENLGLPQSWGFGIHESTDVVGGAVTGGNQRRAVIWSKTGDEWIISELGTLGGSESMALAIGSSGQIVGWSRLPADVAVRAVLWDDGSMQDLGTFGGPSSTAYGLNAAGDIVGWAHTSGGEEHAFLWQDGVMTDLNDLVSPESGFVLERATDINEGGQIVGRGHVGDDMHAFLLTPILPPVPTVSEWGLMVMTLLVLAAGTMLLNRTNHARGGRWAVRSVPRA